MKDDMLAAAGKLEGQGRDGSLLSMLREVEDAVYSLRVLKDNDHPEAPYVVAKVENRGRFKTMDEAERVMLNQPSSKHVFTLLTQYGLVEFHARCTLDDLETRMAVIDEGAKELTQAFEKSGHKIVTEYICHKVVEATKILEVNGLLTPEGGVDFYVVRTEEKDNFEVARKVFARGVPKAGDYLVRYKDGYLSWSPKKAFEEGYTPHEG